MGMHSGWQEYYRSISYIRVHPCRGSRFGKNGERDREFMCVFLVSFRGVGVNTVDLDDRGALGEIGRDDDLAAYHEQSETLTIGRCTYRDSLHLLNLLNLMSSSCRLQALENRLYLGLR